jgi:hypothetical protein
MLSLIMRVNRPTYIEHSRQSQMKPILFKAAIWAVPELLTNLIVKLNRLHVHAQFNACGRYNLKSEMVIPVRTMV